MTGREDEEEFFGGIVPEQDDQSFFSSLYEQDDECPECGNGPLVLRRGGYTCPNRSCRLLVIPNE